MVARKAYNCSIKLRRSARPLDAYEALIFTASVLAFVNYSVNYFEKDRVFHSVQIAYVFHIKLSKCKSEIFFYQRVTS